MTRGYLVRVYGWVSINDNDNPTPVLPEAVATTYEAWAVIADSPWEAMGLVRATGVWGAMTAEALTCD